VQLVCPESSSRSVHHAKYGPKGRSPRSLRTVCLYTCVTWWLVRIFTLTSQLKRKAKENPTSSRGTIAAGPWLTYLQYVSKSGIKGSKGGVIGKTQVSESDSPRGKNKILHGYRRRNQCTDQRYRTKEAKTSPLQQNAHDA